MKPLRLLLGLITILCSVAAVAQSNPVPLINQPLIPVTVKPGQAGFTLTVNGSGFASTAVVNWNGSTRATQFFSSSQLKATIDAADVAQPGTAFVTVTNPTPGGGTSNPVLFPIQIPAPSVAMFPIASFPAASANAVGDFNGDGISDIAVGVNTFPGEIDIYPGKGDGTFGKPIRTQTLVAAASLLVADFNQDGKLDLAVSDGRGTVTVYLGDGKGRFSQQQVLKEVLPILVQTADFNGDGKLDLLIVNDRGNISGIDIRMGKGNGTFGPAQAIHLTNNQQVLDEVAIGDFNQDRVLDLAAPAFGSNVLVFLGNGDGTFQAAVSYNAAFGGSSAVAADVNGDGKLDIVTDGLSVLLGNGDGTFTSDGGVQLQPGGAYVNLADFNGDGKLDAAVVVFNSTDRTYGIDLLLGNGHGTFQNPLSMLTGATAPIVNLSAGDFNQDGKLDLVGGALLFQISASLTPSNLAFGNQTIGTKSAPQIATLTNEGSSALDITSIGITGDPKDFEQTNNCGSSLPPDSSCQIKVTFAPQSVGGKQAFLSVSYKGLGSPQTVSLTGTGLSAATVSLTPASMTFATQLIKTASSPQAATLTNTGSVVVTISNISTSGPFGQTNSCPSDLPVGANCKIDVKFAPTAKGPASGKLSVTDDAKGSPQTVALSGTGTVVEIVPGGVNFGNQKVGTKSSPVGIELTNVGTTALSISGIAITGKDLGDFSQTNNCGTSVPAGGHCTIKVQFAPQTKGPRSAALAVSDDGGGSPQTVPLAGNGT
jgi:hypothetical protein